MLFWLLLALMTGAATFAVLWPLSRERAGPAPASEADLAVYRDQLAEIERDRARGLIGEPEAEAARLEVSRRVLAAADAGSEPTAPGTDRRRRATALAALAGVPVMALAVYGAVGSPGTPDRPLAARLAAPPEQQDASILIQRIEAHLAQNPGDGRGFELLAPIYLRLGRFDDAVHAREQARALLGATAAREADLGEALTAHAGGTITAEARAAFERARAQEPANAKALFFLGLAAEQEGRIADAVSLWRMLAGSTAGDDPWRVAALRRIERHAAGARSAQ